MGAAEQSTTAPQGPSPPDRGHTALLLLEYWFDAPEEAERQAAALLEGW